MAPESPHQETGHTCQHPDPCPSEAEAPVTASQGGEAAFPHQEAVVHPPRGALKGWLLWFLAFFGIYASSSVCPFCGTPGCPVGSGGAALVGGFFAALWQYGKQWFQGLIRFFKKIFF
jgi:hypothetical protein